MKRITMLMMGVMVSALSFAATKSEDGKSVSGIAIVPRDMHAYKLIYRGEERADISVKIYDANDALVFSEVIRNSDGFVRPYDLSSLPAGSYTFKIDNGSNWMSETVVLGPSNAAASSQLIRTQDGKYLLTANARKDFLTVRIVDQKGETVYREFDQVRGEFAKVFNLDKVDGPFSFEVIDESGNSKVFRKN